MAQLNGCQRFLLLSALLLTAAGVVACSRAPHESGSRAKRELSDTGKSAFFTDHRGFDSGIVKEDIERLDEAIAQTPRDARLFVARGFVFAAMTDFSRAIPDFEQAARLDPEVDIANPYGPAKSGILYLTALAYWQDGEAMKAIDLFSRVLKLNPDYARAIFYRGMARLESGDRAGAMEDLAAAARLDSDSLYQRVVSEVGGQPSQGRITTTYVVCFQSNKPPQNRPFGYIWEIQHYPAQ